MTPRYGMTEVEAKKAEDFELRHYYWCRIEDGEAGRHSGFTYHLHETGIGCHVEVECCMCHETSDITDYESW